MSPTGRLPRPPPGPDLDAGIHSVLTFTTGADVLEWAKGFWPDAAAAIDARWPGGQFRDPAVVLAELREAQRQDDALRAAGGLRAQVVPAYMLDA